LRVIILTRDKKAEIRNVNATKTDYEFRNSTYILEPDRVQNYRSETGLIAGQELIFFENNPNPINHQSEPTDLSGTYLDDVVVINFIQQATDTFGKWDLPSLGFLKWFIETPMRIPFVLMVLAVAWTLIKNNFGGLF